MPSEKEIRARMADLENSWQPFKDANPNFKAVPRLEGDINNSGGYPISFHYLTDFWDSDKSTGERGANRNPNRQPRQYQFRRFSIAIMAGLYSNELGDLEDETELYVAPLQELYHRFYDLDGLVENTWLELGKAGRFTFRSADHYGLVVPATVMFSTRYQVGNH